MKVKVKKNVNSQPSAINESDMDMILEYTRRKYNLTATAATEEEIKKDVLMNFPERTD